MRALQIDGPGVVRETTVPIPEIRADEALIRVAYSGICATDYEILGGEMTLVREGQIRYPVRFGHEWSGVVERIGAQVTKFAPGDRVVSDSGVSCGQCPACKDGRYGDCADIRSVGTVRCWDGSFAEYIRIPERHLFKLPGSVSLREAALIEPAGIALAGLTKGRSLAGKTLLVIGTGAIGMTAVALAGHFKPAKILLAGRTDAKLAIGRQLGASRTVNITCEALSEAVFEETGGKGADLIMETSGNISAVNQCVELARAGGAVSYIGFYDKPAAAFPIDSLVSRELSVCGVMGHFGAAKDVIQILESGGARLLPLITHVIPFGEAANALLHPQRLPGMRIKTLVQIDKALDGREG